MKPEISPRDFVTQVCAHLQRVEEFNRRSDASVRMRDLKEKGRAFDFLEGAAFEELSIEERDRLNRGRPVVARVAKKLWERIYGFARAHDVAEHFLTCSGKKAHVGQISPRKEIGRGHHLTSADSESFWRFLQGGAPGLIQQK